MPQVTTHSQLETVAGLQRAFDLGQQSFLSMLIEATQRNAGGDRGGGEFHCRKEENDLINSKLRYTHFSEDVLAAMFRCRSEAEGNRLWDMFTVSPAELLPPWRKWNMEASSFTLSVPSALTCTELLA